jgi:hypothetical protein
MQRRLTRPPEQPDNRRREAGGDERDEGKIHVKNFAAEFDKINPGCVS